MLKGARAQVTAILVAALLVAAASATATYLGTKDHDTDHLAIDVIAHQRELVKEISLLTLTTSQSAALDDAVDRFQQNMTALSAGGEAILANGDTATLQRYMGDDAAQQLQQIPPLWIPFQESARALHSLPLDDPRRPEASAALQEDALQLLAAIERLADTCEAHMASDLAAVRRWQAVLLTSVLPLLGWGIFSVRQRVLRLTDLTAALEAAEPGSRIASLPREVYADEVTDLVASFERMRPVMSSAQQSLEERVSRRTNELMKAFEYSQIIVGQLDKHEIMRHTLAKAEALVAANSVAMCLIESDGSSLELAAVHGRVEASITMSSTLQRAHQPYQIMPIPAGGAPANACKTCNFAQACAGENAIPVPLLAAEKQVGSLCVVLEDGRQLDPFERQGIQLIANSAAIAISNYRLADSSRSQERQDAIKAERERLAAILHDNLAQTLGYLNLKANRIIEMVRSEESDHALNELASMKTATSDAYESVRGVLDDLSQNAQSQPAAAGKSIANFVHDYRRSTGIEVGLFLHEQALNRLSPTVQQQAVHIVREALTNVYRHAQATVVTVRADAAPEGINLAIADNGRGFDPKQLVAGTHLGLAIMRARAERCGGRFSIHTEPGRGTTIIAYLPYQENGPIHAN